MTNELNDGTADDLINLNTQGMDAIINSLYKDLPTSVAANNNLRHSTTTSFYDPTSSSRRKVEAASLPHKVVQPKPRRLTRRRSLESNETSVSVTSKEDKKSFEYRRGSSCDSGIMNLHSMMAASSNHHANNNHRGHQEHRHVSWGRTNVEVIDPEASPDAICKVHEFLGGIPPLPLCNTMKAGNNGTRDTSPQRGIVNLPQEEDEGGNGGGGGAGDEDSDDGDAEGDEDELRGLVVRRTTQSPQKETAAPHLLLLLPLHRDHGEALLKVLVAQPAKLFGTRDYGKRGWGGQGEGEDGRTE